MSHDPSTHAGTPTIATVARRRQRMRRKLAAAVISASLVAPGVAAAAPIDSSHSAGGNETATGAGSGGQGPAGITARRDGSQAEPFVADLGGSAAAANDGDDFAWGDAAIGAGAALGLVALAGGGVALRRRATPGSHSVQTAS
jgi:hypothetical protein